MEILGVSRVTKVTKVLGVTKVQRRRGWGLSEVGTLEDLIG